MAQRGTKPKVDEQGNKLSRNRNQPTHAWLEVPDLPYRGPVPKLPTRIKDGRRVAWSARAKRKWAAWSSMPHCRVWGPTEWDFALDSLEVAERFYDGDRAAATELRNREKQLGTTLDYRRDLRIRYMNPDPHDEPKAAAPEGSVTHLDDWRPSYDD